MFGLFLLLFVRGGGGNSPITRILHQKSSQLTCMYLTKNNLGEIRLTIINVKFCIMIIAIHSCADTSILLNCNDFHFM